MNQIFIRNPKQIDINQEELTSATFKDKTIVVCTSLKLALHLANCFVYLDLKRRFRDNKALLKFPMERSGPFRNNTSLMHELLNLEPTPFQENWLIIDNSKFPEFYDYLVNRYSEHNDDVKIIDERQRP